MKTLKLNTYTYPLFVITILLAAPPPFALAQAGWQHTTDYPANGYQFDPAEFGGRIYVAGGFNGASSSNVFVSAINANTSLGNWAGTTPLPEADPGPGVV